MLITVITATSNIVSAERADSFRRCIESVKNQTYQKIEHIIIDNASSDGTLEIIKEYPHLKCYSKPDSGIFNAFNKGVLHANGKYIAFLNSDDFYHDNSGVKNSVEILEHSQADYSYAPVICLYPGFEPFLLEPQMYSLFFMMPICHQSVFCKREVLIKNPFDENFKFAGDYDWLMKIFMKKYKGILVNYNFATYSLYGATVQNLDACRKECENIFRNNFKPFYTLTNEQPKDYPAELLKALSQYYPDKEKFYQTYRDICLKQEANEDVGNI